MLPLYSATGQPYWFVTTDKMVKQYIDETMEENA